MTGKDLLSDLKFRESYSKYKKNLGRLETWEEAVDDVMSMHYNKFSSRSNWEMIEPYYNKAKQAYKNMEILASQRNLQFREKHINKNNTKLYNCSVTFIDRPEVFSEIMWVLLCGAGVGYSIEKRFVEKLPHIKERPEENPQIFVIPDSIEGWADSIKILMKSYFEGLPRVIFDYSKIRKRGTLIADEFLAPGPEGLKKSIELIENLLDGLLSNKIQHLSTITVHDIICILADAVISGGVRRSALIAIFDKDDELMLKSKTGNWFLNHPWRARANNSVKLLKGSFSKEEFNDFKEYIQQFGEPGIIMVDDMDMVANPCVTKDTIVTTSEGSMRVEDLIGKPFKAIVDGKEYNTSYKGFWSTGVKPVFKLITQEGYELTLTDNHKLLTNNGWKETKDITTEDEIHIHNHENLNWGEEDKKEEDSEKGWVLGSLVGDGSLTEKTAVLKYWGEEYYMHEYASSILNKHFRTYHNFTGSKFKDGITILSVELLKFADKFGIRKGNKTPNHILEMQSKAFYQGFLRGFFDADGSVQGSQEKGVSIRITQANLDILKITQRMLLKLGIVSSIYLNRREEGEYILPDGEGGSKKFFCKAVHELTISCESLEKFKNLVGFKVREKQEKLEHALSNYKRTLNRDKFYSKLKSIEYVGEEEVFDVTVEEVHRFDANGIVAHNCVEIGFIPINPETGNSCWSFCNLNEIIGSKCTTEEEFYKACEAASILGTFQASYTNFEYLGEETEQLVRLESLLGVSITGVMNNPHILLDPYVLREGARIVKKTNKIVADLIGIPQAARTTCIKPSGNASVLAKTASGIHPAHARRYFRTVQLNKDTPMAKYLKEFHPEMLEEGVWSATSSDYACYVPIIEDDKTVVRADLNEIDFLNHVETVYQNWVVEGTNYNLGYSKRVTHNVSNTVTVSDWDKTFDHIYDNQNSFCGLSFLHASGDKVYEQAPFSEVITLQQITSLYGDAAIFASGLIVDALHVFDNNLWNACLMATDRSLKLEGDRTSEVLKKDIIQRIKKFANNYFFGDLDKTINCLKDVHLYHKWVKIERNLKKTPINFDKIHYLDKYLNADELSGAACSGGACEIEF